MRGNRMQDNCCLGDQLLLQVSPLACFWSTMTLRASAVGLQIMLILLLHNDCRHCMLGALGLDSCCLRFM